MAAISTIIAAASLAMGFVSAQEQKDAQNQARQDQERANEENKKARDEQKAAQSAQFAAERRQQLREERVKRAKIIQGSVNAGVNNSSGEAGGTGSLATQLGTNIGFNIGQQRASSAISDAGQNAADFLTSANSHIVDANQWGNVGALSMNIFDKAGGFNSIFPSQTQQPAPVRDAVVKPVK